MFKIEGEVETEIFEVLIGVDPDEDEYRGPRFLEILKGLLSVEV